MQNLVTYVSPDNLVYWIYVLSMDNKPFHSCILSAIINVKSKYNILTIIVFNYILLAVNTQVIRSQTSTWRACLIMVLVLMTTNASSLYSIEIFLSEAAHWKPLPLP